MKHLSNDHKDHPNQHENSHKLCDETGHPVVDLMGSQLKLRRISVSDEINPKEQNYEDHSLGSE